MLTIRLTRKGKKNQPFFRVVVIDKRRSSKGGRSVEDLGYKNPLTKKVSINKERVLYWISKGAKPSPTIHNLLVAEKILDAKKIHVSRLSKKAKEAAAKTQAEKPAAGKTTETKPAIGSPEPEATATEAPAEAPTEPEKPASTEDSGEAKPAEEPKA